MSFDQLLILLPAFFLIAGLYTSVGHVGASGYLAAMALLAIAPETMRPTALALNILVASVTFYRFAGAEYFSWRAYGQPSTENPTDKARIPILPAIGCGAAIGLLSSLTGTGGGIFLSPIVLLAGWANRLRHEVAATDTSE